MKKRPSLAHSATPFLVAIAAGAALGVLAGCSNDATLGDGDGTLQCNNDQSFRIAKFIRVSTMTMCQADPMAMVTSSGGVLNMRFLKSLKSCAGAPPGCTPTTSNFGYWIAPAVQNNLVDFSTPTTPQRNTIEITGFNVTLMGPQGTSLPAPKNGRPLKYFVTSAGGAITPAGGVAAVFAEILPADVAIGLWDAGYKGVVVAHLQPVGTKAGTRMFGDCTEFPIQLCDTCLIANADAQGNVPLCPAAGYVTGQANLGGCRIQEDDAATCCSTDGTPENVVCGPNLPMKTM